MSVDSPPEIAGDREIGDASFNPLPPWSVTAELSSVDDGQGNAADGCQTLIDFPAGHVALLEFGGCQFYDAVQNAQAAGASAAIVMNTVNDAIIDMNNPGPRLEIPAVWVGLTDGSAMREALPDGVAVTLQSVADASMRWVVAEDTSWRGLRDMWHPNCAGDPGKVSDIRYRCGTDDNGGVHSNSGVPNHAFALVVDGGSYNGYGLDGIGLTKATHIYWRAMTEYQQRFSDFLDHADLIELSCQDLVGVNLRSLETGQPSGERLDANDCAQVATAMAAVEMRDFPLQCSFEILRSDAPPIRAPSVVFDESFDTPPGAGWEYGNIGVYPGSYQPRDWVWTADTPHGGSGGAIFATDDDMGGNCSSNDQSGLLYLTSPAIEIPSGSSAIVVFDHYIATEPGFDGGNIKISINGGPFNLVPAEAFRFNPYNTTLEAPVESTNPLAGEPAFSGLNEPFRRGSWGQSQLQLEGIASPGDSLRLRFDFGVDGCTGYDGWYIDNLKVLADERIMRGRGRVQP
jgi:hypothetical protein